jgi:3-methylcrotonyl-CoA carboxylase alpha subunit
VLGVTTNLDFLARVIADKDFAAAKLDTGFIERRKAALFPAPAPVPDDVLAAAALFCLAAKPPSDRGDPWSRRDGWRLNAARAPQTLVFRSNAADLSVAATAEGNGWRLQIGERSVHAAARFADDGGAVLTLGGAQRPAIVLGHGGALAVFIDDEDWRLDRVDPLAPPAGADLHGGRLSAPMPGRVVQLLVVAGDAVNQGQPLIVIEAMKMEHTIAAPSDGIVGTVRYAIGDLVEEGAELITLGQPVAEKP